MQLIILFLFDIIHITDFQIRHYDWYLTLTVLIYGLIYIIPSLILYFWIFKAEGLKELNEWIELRKVGMIFIMWLSVVYCTTKFTVLREIEGNSTQISLYIISLFGICCLSILNGIGCFMGCVEFYNWITGKEYKDIVLKEFDASDVIRSLDKALNEDDSTFSKKLTLLESILRDISLLKQYNHGLYFWIRCGSWVYCFYKVIYGTVRMIQLAIDFVMMRDKGVRENIYHGNGDFISVTLARVIIVAFYDVKANNELLEQISMAINFITSICFFFFSINNVLFTIKNLKALSNKGYFLDPTKVSFDRLIGSYSFEIYNLVIVEIGAVYVVSTALLLNTTNMPFHCSKLMISSDKVETLKKNVGNFVNTDFINDWFDEWFAIGCLLTLIILTLIEKRRVNKVDTVV
ncbi:hypothetical protein CANINC_003822 [Pichia inconspicua]|uniref:Abscisic acid G-protein coupled receptor-like domain-containing protein n=1 Tax=Pichia inconspicua TaxID=52247 RepID=A0A4T0WXY2_9ASCO|nr:hypothetical protein CANINC_003822 [[Candida] inconspicua]